MVSIKIVQLSHQKRKDDTIPVLIRVTQSRKVRYFKTGFAVKSTQFKEGMDNWIVKHNDAAMINLAIEAKRSALMNTAISADIDGQELNLVTLGSQTKLTFFQAIRNKMAVHEQRRQVAAYVKLNTLLVNLKEAWDKDIPVSSLTKIHVENYVNWHLKKGSKINSLKKNLSVMSGVLKSVEEYSGKNYFSIVQSEFKREDVNREKLTASDIKLLESTKIEGMPGVARDMFLFSFYTHGMRFQNVAMFDEKTIKNGMIHYRMNKGKKLREIAVHEKLQGIIDKYKGQHLYLFPALKSKPKDNWELRYMTGCANALINLNLKRVAVICGIDRFSFHQSRHTFSYLSLKRGVTRNVLKDALGHSNYSTTETYLKSLSDDEINDAVKGLYD